MIDQTEDYPTKPPLRQYVDGSAEQEEVVEQELELTDGPYDLDMVRDILQRRCGDVYEIIERHEYTVSGVFGARTVVRFLTLEGYVE